jgi:hypothetical protein
MPTCLLPQSQPLQILGQLRLLCVQGPVHVQGASARETAQGHTHAHDALNC